MRSVSLIPRKLVAEFSAQLRDYPVVAVLGPGPRGYANCYQTYLERDLHQLLQIHNLSLFEKFIKLLAGWWRGREGSG